jgi:N-6 DNA Methylase
MRTLKQCEMALNKQSELRTAYDQWRRFLSIAYGRFDDSPAMFLVHTYLSVFAKLLAYAVISKRQISDDKTLSGILNGKIFEEQLLVERFVEDDFFHWVATPEHFKTLKPMFRELIRQIEEYDFSAVQEDILKGVYQELIDLETRHALGEYFTPDWLCERMLDELSLQRDSRILDPACGSGSFLRAAVAKLRTEHPKMTAEELATQICGIDIHPLSVQIAKTTVLLSLSGLIEKAKKPITLHIYLANSLLVPEETADLFKSTFKMSIDNKQYAFNVSGVVSQEHFDQLITLCDDLVGR